MMRLISSVFFFGTALNRINVEAADNMYLRGINADMVADFPITEDFQSQEEGFPLPVLNSGASFDSSRSDGCTEVTDSNSRSGICAFQLNSASANCPDGMIVDRVDCKTTSSKVSQFGGPKINSDVVDGSLVPTGATCTYGRNVGGVSCVSSTTSISIKCRKPTCSGVTTTTGDCTLVSGRRHESGMTQYSSRKYVEGSCSTGTTLENGFCVSSNSAFKAGDCCQASNRQYITTDGKPTQVCGFAGTFFGWKTSTFYAKAVCSPQQCDA